jgi:tetratricopeptide (TPR) repeat protein/glycosyltransferase involved in cell wall biosynthesis
VNSFNADFLNAFALAYNSGVKVICVVASDTPEEREAASKANVQLVSLPYSPQEKLFNSTHAQVAVEQLNRGGIRFDADKTIWLGHDRITGEAAIAAAGICGGRSAVIHHMSYDHYETYAEDSHSALRKTREQTELLQNADLVLAVGPLLRDAAGDRLNSSKPVHMLIPGLAEIDAQDAPKTFVAFLSGRLSDDAARIKQGQLGIAAFARAEREAREDGMPDALRKRPKLLLRGVDFEDQLTRSSLSAHQDPETELKQFAETYADAVINLHALPFTYDRQQLYSELKGASVALMPSWHEGFGLVAWEAIAAGVPLILGMNSGVYRLLEEEYPGADTGYVYPIDIRGKTTSPYFHDEDLRATVAALKEIANNPNQARKKAGQLKNLLRDRTWAACAEQAANAFGWELRKGSIPDITPALVSQTSVNVTPDTAPADGGRAPLQMPTGQWRAGAGMADSQLLRAEEALLPFDAARQPDIDNLNEWLDDARWPQAVRLITGAGGQGKTRLALELCKQRLASGWFAGFLDSDLEVNRLAAGWQTLRNYNQPILIVIDYAETRQTPFLTLLKAALQNPSAHPVRMLLLARDGGEWWDKLPGKDSFCESFLSGYATSGPFRLPPLYVAEHDRREAFGKALRAFAGTLGVDAPGIVPSLLGEHFERPLYVQMAALLALYGEAPTTAQGLTRALLHHERRYWIGLLSQFNWPEPDRRAEQLLALTTLAGGFVTPRAAEPYWGKAKGEVLSPAEFSALFRTLATLYPGTQGLQALRPDLLGEALVAQALLHPGGETLLDAVLDNTATKPIRRNALTVLARLSTQRSDVQETLVEAFAQHFTHCYQELVAVGAETTSHLPALAELAFARLPSFTKSQAAGLLEPLLMGKSVQLAELSCMVSEYLVEKARDKFEQKPGNLERMTEYARLLTNYALGLARIGNVRKACEVSLVGLELYRRLTIKNPDRYEPAYATSLSNYALYLSDAGQYEEALDHSRRAVEIHERLARKNPDRYEPNYASSLSNYSKSLGDTGCHEEALEHSRRAVEIRERLARDNPDRYEPDYATALSNYASDLSDAGRYEEALEFARQSLEIHERLARKNPDRYEPDYATALSNYAIRLSDAGRYEEALDHARQSLEIRERLAQKNIKRNAEDLFTATCFADFLAWLCDKERGVAKFDLNQIMASIPSHQRPLMLLFSAFVEGCWATDRDARNNAFRQALTVWNDLSVAGRIGGAPYWLCAAAWCAEYEPANLSETDWLDAWRHFAEQRKGRIPNWMLDVARRLEFEWPE